MSGPATRAAPVVAVSSVPKVASAPKPEPKDEPSVSLEPVEHVPPSTELRPAVESTPLPLEGEMAVMVETDPTGATIVVNGLPVGRAPRKVFLPVTAQGFAKSTFTIKARFVAESSAEHSTTTEVELTPLDRLPSGLLFTRERVVRKR
ncbi:MAG: PEGA domain-containing protein [Opitutaceae bacterium]|nr:PEGA domain-containing protein [Opitutaceae bacterium]